MHLKIKVVQIDHNFGQENPIVDLNYENYINYNDGKELDSNLLMNGIQYQ